MLASDRGNNKKKKGGKWDLRQLKENGRVPRNQIVTDVPSTFEYTSRKQKHLEAREMAQCQVWPHEREPTW